MICTDKPIADPGIALAEERDDWAVLFDPTDADAVEISHVGVAVWKLMDGRRDIRRIIASIRARFTDAPDTAAVEVAGFIDALAKRGWVRRDPGEGDPRTAGESVAGGDQSAPREISRARGLHRAPGFSSGPSNEHAPGKRGKVGALLTLADGSEWAILGGDPGASRVISRFAEVMGAPEPPASFPSDPARPDGARRELVFVSDGARGPGVHDASRVLGRVFRPDAKHYPKKYMRLSSVLAHEIQARGGLFLHGALAVLPPAASPRPFAGFPDEAKGKDRVPGRLEGSGVILAGPHDVGKTTAGKRLPPPWRALSDDVTLVVRDAAGRCWAHPWPTWTLFSGDGPGGRWDVGKAAPLKAVFFLEQARRDRATPLTPAQAIPLLVSSPKQISWLTPRPMKEEAVRAFNLKRFDAIRVLARATPAHLLHISLAGEFWREMERVLEK
ncbi:MAG: PqqD family peptide modification chaperone [Desulfobacterales bacterium]|nr:PqqD family peptide modification chaperone [Desulfobacterales bacterium]